MISRKIVMKDLGKKYKNNLLCNDIGFIFFYVKTLKVTSGAKLFFDTKKPLMCN